MRIAPRCPRVHPAFALPLLLLVFALGAEAAGPKRVLILHSFGRDFAPFDTVVAVFRAELAQRSQEPITFVEANLDFARPNNPREESVFIQYLRERFSDAPPDVVVTLGAGAAIFYSRYRDALFPGVVLVYGALDERSLKALTLRPGDHVAASKVDLPELINNILSVLPKTRTIAVAMGNSGIERFWVDEIRREVPPRFPGVSFVWLNELPLARMRERVASLPSDSAVFYGLFVVDAAGVPHERQDVLAALHEVSNAPIFGVYEDELGKGAVGGPYTSQRRVGEQMASAALRALNEAPAPEPRISIAAFERPVYDWRELRRWDIDHARLPPDASIRFKDTTIWQQHPVAAAGIIVVLVLQSLLIGGLMWHRVRLRRAEQEARGLGGRLITAHEDERRRIARELHDDFTQRLAGLAIETAKMEGAVKDPEGKSAAHSIREGLTVMSEDVHAMSYRLHPSVIEDLGLEEALRTECDRFARYESIRVELDAESVPESLSPEPALCLFRIAQESLRNVSRHANASKVDVSLRTEGEGLGLEVCDNGRGFDVESHKDQVSLGLASMRERVRLLGGRIDVESQPGQGTWVRAWVPLKRAA
ncbi:MAG: sensor histidine kinase [Burkholderiales bacterium]